MIKMITKKTGAGGGAGFNIAYKIKYNKQNWLISNNQQVMLYSTSEVSNSFNINNTNYLYFLGGFVEGEGSNSISIVVNKDSKYGITLQPVFNVSQHKNGLNILYSFKELFEAGSLVEKSGSPDIWVYTLKGYKQMIEKVIPFLKIYVQPFSCKKKEFEIFFKIVSDLAEGKQKNQEGLIEMIELIYTYEGKGKYRKRSLEEIIYIINNKDSYFFNVESASLKLKKEKDN